VPVNADAKVTVTAVVDVALGYACVPVLVVRDGHAAHVVQPELAKVMVTVAAALKPVMRPTSLVPVGVPALTVGVVPENLTVPGSTTAERLLRSNVCLPVDPAPVSASVVSGFVPVPGVAMSI
jgi:hypothetical protein